MLLSGHGVYLLPKRVILNSPKVKTLPGNKPYVYPFPHNDPF